MDSEQLAQGLDLKSVNANSLILSSSRGFNALRVLAQPEVSCIAHTMLETAAPEHFSSGEGEAHHALHSYHRKQSWLFFHPSPPPPTQDM